MSTHPEPTVRPVPDSASPSGPTGPDPRRSLLNGLTRALAGLHALVGLLAVLGALLALVGFLLDTSGDPMAGFALVVAGGLAMVGLPLLVAATLSVCSRRPGRVHGAALATVAWVALVVGYTFVGGPLSWLLGLWVLYLPAHPVVALPTVALLLSAVAGLTVRRAP